MQSFVRTPTLVHVAPFIINGPPLLYIVRCQPKWRFVNAKGSQVKGYLDLLNLGLKMLKR
jgi:hypothetical protein